MATKLKITFVTSKEANKYVEDQIYEMIAKKLLKDPNFRVEIGLDDNPNGEENTVD